jgi:hypothetical protein
VAAGRPLVYFHGAYHSLAVDSGRGRPMEGNDDPRP